MFENTPFNQRKIETFYKKEQLHGIVNKRTNSPNSLLVTFFVVAIKFKIISKPKSNENQWTKFVYVVFALLSPLHCIKQNLFLIIGTKIFVRFDFRLS